MILQLGNAFLKSFLLCTEVPGEERKGTDKLLLSPQPSVGQVARVDVSSKVEVVWADNSKTIILPQVRSCSQNRCNS